MFKFQQIVFFFFNSNSTFKLLYNNIHIMYISMKFCKFKIVNILIWFNLIVNNSLNKSAYNVVFDRRNKSGIKPNRMETENILTKEFMKVNQSLPQMNHHLGLQHWSTSWCWPSFAPVSRTGLPVRPTGSKQKPWCWFDKHWWVCEEKPLSSINMSLLEPWDA